MGLGANRMVQAALRVPQAPRRLVLSEPIADGTAHLRALLDAHRQEMALQLDQSWPELIAQGLFTYRSGLDAAEQLLELADPPTAIFASNDDMAAAAVAMPPPRRPELPGLPTVLGCALGGVGAHQQFWQLSAPRFGAAAAGATVPHGPRPLGWRIGPNKQALAPTKGPMTSPTQLNPSPPFLCGFSPPPAFVGFCALQDRLGVDLHRDPSQGGGGLCGLRAGANCDVLCRFFLPCSTRVGRSRPLAAVGIARLGCRVARHHELGSCGCRCCALVRLVQEHRGPHQFTA